jgi:DnaJ-class molecular chaperone
MGERKERCVECFGSGRNTYNKECACEKCKGQGYVLIQYDDVSSSDSIADGKVEEGNLENKG